MKFVPRDNAAFFDIEVKPIPPEEVEKISPFDAEAWIKAERVKILADKRIKKEETRERKLSEIEGQVEEQKRLHYNSIARDACLAPLFGEVLCLSFSTEPGECRILDKGEDEILTMFWRELVPAAISGGDRLIGWNIFEYDLPFMLARTRVKDLTHEILDDGTFGYSMVMDPNGYWNEDLFMDLRRIWGGRNRFAKGTLDEVARAMGHAGKSIPSGQFLWELWNKDRERAREYIRSEVQAMRDVAESMGIYL